MAMLPIPMLRRERERARARERERERERDRERERVHHCSVLVNEWWHPPVPSDTDEAHQQMERKLNGEREMESTATDERNHSKGTDRDIIKKFSRWCFSLYLSRVCVGVCE